MTLDPQIRTQTQTRTRRRSTCHLHPNEPITGLCALCLRDRLAFLDSSSNQPPIKHENIISFPLSRRTGGHASSSSVPQLRRSKSVAVEKCDDGGGGGAGSFDLRRKSCDVRVSNNLTDLFHIEDTNTGSDRVVRVESKNLGFIEPVLEIIEDNDDSTQVRVSDEDLMTMKEHIDLEFQLQSKKKKFWDSASVFGQKLLKWRQKHKEKKRNGGNKTSNLVQCKDSQIQTEVPDYGGLGRRSCDTAPRFSIDIHRMSVDDHPRFSLDEHRASWDGYMIARTIPRLTPMLPIVDNIMLPPVNKGIAVKEDVSSCSVSAKSNSDMCSSNTGSSSSSMKSSSSKTTGLERLSRGNDGIGLETKLVITEKELKDWHLSSIKDNNVEYDSNARSTVKNLNGHNKEMNGRWRKMSNLWSDKYKHGDKKNGDSILENGNRINETNVVERGISNAKLVRNSSMVGSRNSSMVGSRNSSMVGSRNRRESLPTGQDVARHSMSDIDSGLLKLHLSPFTKSRKVKF